MSIVDLKKNTVVESGAGCGKTYQLVKAFVKGLKEKRFHIDEAVAITFTIKAAAELKERIIIELEEEISSGNAELTAELLNIGSSNISTIHAFCIRMLKERPVEAGVDPNFEILPEENYNFFHETFNLWLREKSAECIDFLDLAVLVKEIPLRKKSDSGYGRGNTASIEELMQAMIEHRELDFFLPGLPQKKYGLHDFYNEALALVEQAGGHSQLKLFFSSALLPVRQALKMQEGQARHLKGLSFKPGNRGGAEYAELRRAWVELFEQKLDVATYGAIFNELQQFYKLTNEAMASFRDFYRARLRAEGLIDFSEVLVLAEELLRKSRLARDYFKKRFRFFFVDEFQDTDPLQARILSYLCEDQKSFTENWQEVKLAKAKICVVGDVKQSIYRFRRADIETFQFMADKIKESETGAAEQLTVNRRSTQSIVDYVNGLFSNRMQEASGRPYQAPYENMSALTEAARGEKIVYAQALTESPARKIADYRDVEARLSAQVVKKLIDEKGLRPDEITLLYRVKANMQATADYLAELGIPSMMYGVTSYLDRREVREVCYLLRAIDNPLDSIAVAATLKGMFFSATDEDFASMVEAHRQNGSPYYGFIDYRFADKNNAGALAAPMQVLKRWHDDAPYHPPHILLENILTESGVYAALAATYNADQKIYNLMKAVVLLNRMQNLSFSQAVARFREYIETTPEMPELSFEREESQVQLMTIHAAKGLENRAIVLADTTGAGSFGNQFFANNLNNQFIYLLDPDLVPFEYRRAAHEDSLREKAELERLRYVAATRAKEWLIINYSGYESSSERFIAAFYDEPCPVNTWKVNVDGITLQHGRLAGIEAALDPELSKEQASVKERCEKQLSRGHMASYHAISPSEIKEDDEASYRLEVSVSDEDFSYYLEKVPQHILGRIVHKMLELNNEEQARNAASILIEENRLQVTVDEIFNIYQNFLKNPVLQELKTARRVFFEMPVKYAGEDGCLYDGAVDLLFETAEGFTLADFKVLQDRSAARLNEVEAKYKPQLNAYARGFEKVGIKINRMVIIA